MISVIIPTLNTPTALDLCLKSAIDGQQQQNEIIVVVDGDFNINKEVLSKYSLYIKPLILEKNVEGYLNVLNCLKDAEIRKACSEALSKNENYLRNVNSW